ncbi:MAG: hypothetical protein ABR562_08555, partial [Thermoplasmatota archaeon]
NVHAHIGGPSTVANAIEAKFHWDNKTGKGRIESTVMLGLDFDQSPLGRTAMAMQHHDQAVRFLQRYNGDVYRALVEAATSAFTWIEATTGIEDLEALKNETVGKFRLTLDLDDPVEFQQMLNAATGGPAVDLGPAA